MTFEMCVVICLTVLLIVIVWKVFDYATVNGGLKRLKDYRFKAILYRKEYPPEVMFRGPGVVIDGKNVEWETQEDLETNSVNVIIRARFDRYDLHERI